MKYTLPKDVKIGVNHPLFRGLVNEKGAYEALRTLNGIGVHYIENSQMATDEETLSEMRRAFDDFGMELCAATANIEPSAPMQPRPGMPANMPKRPPTDNFIDNWDKILKYCKEFNCTEIRTTYAPPGTWDSREGILNFCKVADEWAKKLNDEGIHYSYHTHPQEFKKHDGEIGMYIVLNNTKYLTFEPCSYWITYGGCDLETFVRDFGHRSPVMHLKDYRIQGNKRPDPNAPAPQRPAPGAAPAGPPAGMPQQGETAECGEGNQNLAKIIKIASDLGTRYFFLEQDNKCGRSELECIQTSYTHLYEWGYGRNM